MKYLFIFLAGVVLFSCSTQNSEIYQWRGENRNGIFNEENLLKTWPENGPEEIWFVENIGNGYSSPTVTDKEVFVTGEKDSLAWLFCFNLKGNLKWKQNIGNEWVNTFPGSRSQPTVVDDLIYVGTGIGNLYCLKRENGKIVWSKDLINDFQGICPRVGHSEAPVVDGDKVFWTPGGKMYNVVALNRFSGKLIWSCKGAGERSAYNPGNIIELPSRKIFVTFSAYHLMGIDVETGKLLWTHVQDNTPVDKRSSGIGDTHGNNIIYEDGAIYYAAGDGNCGVKLQLSEDGSKITEVWRNKDFDCYMGGILKIGDHLYGSGTSKNELKSIDANTGILTATLKIGFGTIISADNALYYYNQRGQISLVNYENGLLKQQSMFKITRGTKEHFSHPVIKNGILYQRHGNALIAFNIRNA